jgi:L-seryl-tRNA(Ser) seleniumtransferase
MDIQASLKKLPSVEAVLEEEAIAARINILSKRGITSIVRESIGSYRESLKRGEIDPGKGRKAILEEITRSVLEFIDSVTNDRQRKVINATGVVLHTNIGRAVLSEDTAEAVLTAARNYTDLEIDLSSGKRTGRTRRVERLLKFLTGCDDALVVNNNAAAVLLAVNTIASKGAVAVSRGELVEIGGSFRLPEILAGASNRVLEIGTTNRTHIKDYERAIDDGATLLLKVHTSNYRIVGFTDEVLVSDLVKLGKSRDVPVMYDQGSGILYPLETRGFTGEENLLSILDSGIDIVSFSADKVLGGPQAGIILGRSDLVSRMRSNHLARALRIDKMTLAGLEQVLVDYCRGEFERLPALEMILKDLESLRARSEQFRSELISGLEDFEVEVEEGESSIGGGSFPINPLRTILVKINLTGGDSVKFTSALRDMDPSVLVRVKGDSIYLDLRTVAPDDQNILVENLRNAFGKI